MPIIPFVLVFDGFVSALRTRTPQEVEVLLRTCGAEGTERVGAAQRPREAFLAVWLHQLDHMHEEGRLRGVAVAVVRSPKSPTIPRIWSTCSHNHFC